MIFMMTRFKNDRQRKAVMRKLSKGAPMPRVLPVVKIGGKQYIRDKRLGEYRNVRNPHDRLQMHADIEVPNVDVGLLILQRDWLLKTHKEGADEHADGLINLMDTMIDRAKDR